MYLLTFPIGNHRKLVILYFNKQPNNKDDKDYSDRQLMIDRIIKLRASVLTLIGLFEVNKDGDIDNHCTAPFIFHM